jgi:hypothetical protein
MILVSFRKEMEVIKKKLLPQPWLSCALSFTPKQKKTSPPFFSSDIVPPLFFEHARTLSPPPQAPMVRYQYCPTHPPSIPPTLRRRRQYTRTKVVARFLTLRPDPQRRPSVLLWRWWGALCQVSSRLSFGCFESSSS